MPQGSGAILTFWTKEKREDGVLDFRSKNGEFTGS